MLAMRLDAKGDAESADAARDVAERVREICGDLRPPLLGDFGVGPALEWRSRYWRTRGWMSSPPTSASGPQVASISSLPTGGRQAGGRGSHRIRLPKYAEAALRMGAVGYVLKSSPSNELLTAIRKAAAGELVFGVRPSAHVRLTPLETAIVSLVADGRSNDEIRGQLGISARTVETHLRHLFERLAVASRTELASRALREGWLDVPA